jgi:hypothetical protein
MLFSPSLNSLIPEGNISFDLDDVTELVMLSEGRGTSPADGFLGIQRHFIMNMSDPTLSKLLITFDEPEDNGWKSSQVRKVVL